MAVETIPASGRRDNAVMRLLRGSSAVRLWSLLFPGLFWLIVFFALPLVVILLYSFLTPGPRGGVVWNFTLNNYFELFTESLFVNAYIRSIWLGIVTTVLCLLVSYPLAVFIARASPRWRTVLLFLVLIPFWT